MRKFLQFLGTVVYFFAWPVFWVYFKRDIGRTRVVLIADGKILVMKQWIGSGDWQLPGGGLHKDEEPLPGAVREVKEETSLVLDNRQLLPLGSHQGLSRGSTYTFYLFAAKVKSTAVYAQHVEVSELAWISPGELTRKNTKSDVLQALQIVREHSSLLQ